MALTKQQIVDKLTSRYSTTVRSTLTWANVTSIIGATSQETKAEILEALKARHAGETGQVILRLVDDWVKSKAQAEIDTKIVNNTITIADLGTILE